MATGTIAAHITHLHPDESGFQSALEKLTTDYPYCSLAHLLLLKATDETDPAYAKRASKAQLHLQQPFLLQYQLRQPWFPEKAAGQSTESNTGIDASHTAISAPSAGEAILSELTAAITPKQAPETEVEKQDSIPVPVTEPSKPVVESNEVEPLAEPVVPAPVSAEPLLFEPLHTTDYFASQGIRITDEMKGSDKLGTQLRSFTEWLKTMKKVHGSKLPADTGKPLDSMVQQLAEKSNVEEEVITESMAEVYVQQGKRAKAIEIYEKLSLQNPAKSAYFAAKIELIKAN